jgi:hypothetical protein
MALKTKTMNTKGILAYLEKPDNFARVEHAYPDMDIDIAIDLLHDPSHQLNADVKAFLNDAIAHVSQQNKLNKEAIAPTRAKADFSKTKISTKRWLAIQSARLAVAIVKHGGRAAIEKIPNAAIGLTAASMLLGNIPDADPNYAVNQLCNSTAYNLCITPETIATMKHDDQLVLTSMIQTSTSQNERDAISAIATASAQTGVDFTFMLVFAQLESSLGKQLSTPGSTAEGIFQYVEGTWLESFKKHAADFDPAYAAMAESIYFDSQNGTFETDPAELRADILSLRIDNPELHSYINGQDMQNRDPMVLSASLDALQPKSPQQSFMRAAESGGVEIAASIGLKFYNDFLEELGRESEYDRENISREQRRDTVIRLATVAYLDHFLGETGARRFMSVYEDTNSDLRNRPVGELTGRDTPPISQWAIDANPGIFHGGDQTSVQVYSTIETRVEAALELIENRMDVAKTIQSNIIITNDTMATIAPDQSKRPEARPSEIQLARN